MKLVKIKQIYFRDVEVRRVFQLPVVSEKTSRARSVHEGHDDRHRDDGE